MTIARRLRIHGLVQGVFYRAWAADAAGRLGLVGWVRNRRDGTVEAIEQGDEGAVLRFIAEAKSGPPRARVDRVEVSDAEPDAALTAFRQERTT